MFSKLKFRTVTLITISLLATTANASILNFKGGITKNYANKWAMIYSWTQNTYLIKQIYRFHKNRRKLL
jgi:hypothetical protein